MQKIINKQRAPKDTVLNNILQEIDEENGVNNIPKKEIPEKKKKEKSGKVEKRSWLSIIFYLMLVAIIFFILIIIYFITIATKDEKMKTAERKEVFVPIKKIKKEIKNIEKNAQYIILPKKPKVEKEKVIMKPIHSIVSLSKEERERKKAKATLMEQMKN